MKKSLLILPALIFLGCISYLSIDKGNKNSAPVPQSTQTPKLEKQSLRLPPSEVFESSRFIESKPALSPQRQNLLKESEAIMSETYALAKGFKQSTLFKTDFKYPNVQCDIFTDEAGKYLKSEYFIADHVMVKFPSTLSTKEIYSWAKQRGFHVRNKLRTDSIYLIATETPQLFDSENLVASFEKDFPESDLTQVAGIAEKDFIYTTQVTTPNDSSYSSLWGLNNTGQTGGTSDADIDAPEAWDITTGNKDVIVAVIDTGVDMDHPDLADNIWTNPNEIAGNGIDDDNNGFIDDVHGWDFRNDDSNPDDDDDHGTHCSGTIGAVGNNSSGVVGVAWDVSIVPIKFLGTSGGTTSDAIDSVNYTTALGVDLTSNSWGGGGYSLLLEDAILNAGDNEILFVAAAGNDSSNNDSSPQYPCSYDVDTIISVASTADDETLSSFSNYGATTVDLGAPGSAIYSTVRNGSYSTFSGTSMATPHVSGVLCLMKSLAPNLSALELKSHLLEYTDQTAALNGSTLSGGRLNAHTAVLNLQGSYIKVATLRVETSTGNFDDFVNPGETGSIIVSFTNSGSEVSHNATASAASLVSSANITIDSSPLAIGTIASGSTTGEFSIPFTVQAGTSTPTHHQFEITSSDDHQDGETYSSSLDIYNSATISGRIFSLVDNSNIVGALVQANGEVERTTNSDSNGNFTFTVVDGTYDISAAATGYITSEETSHTVPPNISGLTIGLGVPDLNISPSSISETVYAGTIETVDLTLSNDGTATVEWSLITQKNAAPSSQHFLLPARVATFIDSDSKTLDSLSESITSELNAATSTDFNGLNFAIIGTHSSSLASDAISLGAVVSYLSFPLTTESLATYDALFIDDAISSASSSDIALIRDWVHTGGGLMLTGDSYTDNNNSILAQTGIITVSHSGYLDTTVSDISTHDITEGVETVYLRSYGTTCSLTTPAVSLMRNDSGADLMAVSSLGLGRVAYLSNEINSSYTQDGRTLMLNTASYLAGVTGWLSTDLKSGSIAAGQTETVTVTIDTTNQMAGTLFGIITFNSNDLSNGVQNIPIEVTVLGSPSIASNFSNHDFGTQHVDGNYTVELEISNPGTDDLVISSGSFAGTTFSTTSSFPLTIPARGTEVITVTFSPTTIGSFNDSLTLLNNSPTQSSYVVSLSGTSLAAPRITLNTTSFDVTIPLKSTSTELLQIGNDGGADLHWLIETQLSTQGPLTSTEWLTLNKSAGSTVSTSTDTIELAFSPSDLAAGLYEGQLLIRSNDPNNAEKIIDLAMTVTSRPIMETDQSSVDFGDITNNTASQQNIQITNSGDQPLSVTDLIFSDASFSAPGATTFSLQPGETHFLTILFSPSALGQHDATLTINNDTVVGSASISLSANSLERLGITSIPTSLEYSLEAGTLIRPSLELLSSYSSSVDFSTYSKLNSSTSSSLAGVNVGMLSYTSSQSFLTDLIEGESGTTDFISIYDTLTADLLSNYDLIITDYTFEYISSSNRAILQTWLDGGGSLFIHNSGSTYTDQAALLTNYGLSITSYYTSSSPASPWEALTPSHPISENADTLPITDVSYSYQTHYTVTEASKSQGIYVDNQGRTRAVAAEYLKGKVVTISTSAEATQFVSSEENALFLKKCLAWLSKGHLSWIHPYSTEESLLPNGSLNYPITLNAQNLYAGTYSADFFIKNRDTGIVETTIPIYLTVTGEPNLTCSTQEILFENLVLSQNLTKTITLTNSGTSNLSVSSITSSSNAFATDLDAATTIAPGKSVEVNVTFTPSIAQTYEESITINSDDPDTPIYEIQVYARAVGSPEIQVPASLAFTVASGSSISTSFDIQNLGESELNWQIFPTTSAADRSLPEVLDSLESYSDDLINVLPEPYAFTEGEIGDDISDGGRDMFNTGNEIETNYDPSPPYSNFEVQSSNGNFGPGGSYFTAKLPGLFVLGADLDGVTHFAIDGFLGGGSSSGTVAANEFNYTFSGINYKVFTKKVFGKSSPSVNHLIILEDSPDLIRTYESSTYYDDHFVTGIENHSRLYYLMFGQENGGEVPDEEFQTIAQQFIQVISTQTSSNVMHFSPTIGSTAAMSTSAISATFDALTLNAGDFKFNCLIKSDDLDTPIVNIPVDLTVTGSPKIATSTTYLNFPATVIGLNTEILLEIENSGSEQLNLTGLNFANTLFSAENWPSSISPGESVLVAVKYSPSISGLEQGSLSILSDAANASSYEILLSGVAVLPPAAVVNTTTRDHTLGANTSFLSNFDIQNTGNSTLTWDASIDYGPTSNSIGTPQYDGLKVLAVDYSSVTDSYAYLESYVEAAGGSLDEVLDDNFNLSDLVGYDVLILGSSTYLTTTEYTEINTWISNGGALLFDYSSSSSSYTSALFNGTGIATTYNYSGSSSYSNFPYHPITQGVSSISGYKRLDLSLSGDAYPLVWSAEQEIYAAASTLGSGKVVALTDSLADISITNSDNRRFIENTLLWLGNKQRGWLSLLNSSGNTPIGDAHSVLYQVNSSSLTLGSYTADIVIHTNDPNQLEIRVPVEISVTNASEIYTDIEALYFENTFVNSTSTQDLTISNNGYSPLVIDSMPVTGDFSINESFPITLNPDESLVIDINFNPLALGLQAGSVTIHSNALTSPDKVIELQGVGSAAPSLTINLDSISIISEVNQVFPESIPLTNNGSGALHWQLSRARTDQSSVSTEILNGRNVGFLSQSSSTAPFETILSSYGANVIQLATELSQSSLEPIEVLIYDGSFTLSASSLNLLDTWVQDGGSLFTCDDSTARMSAVLARFDCSILYKSGSYSTPIYPTGEHITLTDITTINAYYPDAELTSLPESATPLLIFENNDIAGALLSHGKGQVIALSFEAMYASSISSGDGEQFITNCICYLANTAPWIETPQLIGSISPGESDSVYLNIDTGDLTEGTYNAFLTFETNDPLNPSQDVSINLIVLPEFPTSIYTTWLNEHLPSAISNIGFGEDYDNDGLSNGVEFYFSSDPGSHDAKNHLPQVHDSDFGPVLSYTRATDLSDDMLIWKCSSDLKNWSEISTSEMTSSRSSTPQDNGDGTTTVTIGLNLIEEPSQFFLFKMWDDYGQQE
ncbi:S8 family serine peptidase [Rubritalea sp.]|uniref:S8 family serine peptidase n=1 Tax=Rubritalea sp. TaxID=2109375 RepID=UPI003EF3026C